MNRPVKEIDWSLYVGKVREELLKGCHCSAAWLKACVTKVTTGEGDKASIDISNYPPGGAKGTGMVNCPECKRWAPRDAVSVHKAHKCMECVVLNQEEAFLRNLQALSDKFIAMELIYLHRHTVSTKILVEQYRRNMLSIQEGYDSDSGEAKHSYRVAPQDYWEKFEAHHRWVGKDTAPAVYPREDNYFDNTHEKYFSRRCLGCQTVLLSEDERSLKEEIDYYWKNGKLCPPVEQDDSVDPFN